MKFSFPSIDNIPEEDRADYLQSLAGVLLTGCGVYLSDKRASAAASILEAVGYSSELINNAATRVNKEFNQS